MLTGHMNQWANFYTRSMHIDTEVRDAFVLWCVRVGTCNEHANIGFMAKRGPHLLTRHHPLVAITFCFAGQ